MPELSDRDKHERKLARLLAGSLAGLRGEVLRLLGDPPDLTKLDTVFWNAASTDLQNALRPFLLEIATIAAEALGDTLPIGVEWGLVNENAAEWARQYTFELVRGINNTSRTGLQNVISAFFDDQLTVGELEQRVSTIFGPSRAQTIAQTEITRAASEGEKLIQDDLARQGVEMVRVWQTSRDEIVCPICAPLNGVRTGLREPFQHPGGATYDQPPAHPNCRCWMNSELPQVTV